ncbi:MAG TPA: 3-isopropylmalate dehydratase small subunit [Gemmatimonadaceae bacterium]|nr:3-isopropylmalate dehydratase small subunit [Gemmatimonadaceae bacterium]
MTIHLDGRARIVGADINTDYIIASTRKRDTLDEQILKHYLLETVDPAFAASVQPSDLLVAGTNFGCGSAMEIAATVILAAGISAVLARTFSRTFFRNAINNGLLPVECDTSDIGEGDRLVVSSNGAVIDVENRTRGTTIVAAPLPALMADILAAGGLVEFTRQGGWSRTESA